MIRAPSKPTNVRRPNGFDWREWLEDGARIVSSSWSVSPAGLSILDSANDGERTVVWIAHGTPGVTYTVTNTITTDTTPVAQVDQRSFTVLVTDVDDDTVTPVAPPAAGLPGAAELVLTTDATLHSVQDIAGSGSLSVTTTAGIETAITMAAEGLFTVGGTAALDGAGGGGGGGGAYTYFDDFDRSPAVGDQTLSADYVVGRGTIIDNHLNGGARFARAPSPSAGLSYAYLSTSVRDFGDDHRTEVSCATTAVGDTAGAVVRGSGTVGYAAYYHYVTQKLYLVRFSGNTETVLAESSGTMSAPTSYVLEAVGTEISVHNGAGFTWCSATDATHSSGQPGIYFRAYATFSGRVDWAEFSEDA